MIAIDDQAAKHTFAMAFGKANDQIISMGYQMNGVARWFAWTFYLLLPAPLVVNAAEPASRYKTDFGGIEVQLIPDKSEIMIGEPVFLSLSVRNLSDTNLQTIQGGDYGNRLGRPESYSITAINSKGEAVPVLESGDSMGGLIGPQKIPAKGTWVRKLFLPQWIKLNATGEYTISCKTILKLSKYAPIFDFNKEMTGPTIEVNAHLNVVPLDEKKMGEVIDKLGHTMLAKVSDADDAIQSLDSIEDERVIPFLNQAVDKRGYSLEFRALQALGRFKNDEALIGIKKAMKMQMADVREFCTTDKVAVQRAASIRQSAAVALSTSPNSKAKELLLSMRTDPYDGVRITVLHVVAVMDTQESLTLLQNMTHDPDKMVREEALQYLKLRTEQHSK